MTLRGPHHVSVGIPVNDATPPIGEHSVYQTIFRSLHIISTIR